MGKGIKKKRGSCTNGQWQYEMLLYFTCDHKNADKTIKVIIFHLPMLTLISFSFLRMEWWLEIDT